MSNGTNEKPKFKKLAQFQTPDGRIFNTQREASEHMRSYLVVDAFTKVLEGVTNIDAQWFVDNKDAVLKAYRAAEVERKPPSPETLQKMKEARDKMTAAYREKYGTKEQPKAA